jgi:hypothetical protein
MGFGIDFGRKYSIDYPREMASDELEFASDQRILG